ncbi:hypothetical protein [Rhodoferax sp.]|jgi:hypothetical protein|uniref:hypothetical protein n=1 Tax=Rhodoferax sp. TaxID=50421 RepID=UPI003785080A
MAKFGVREVHWLQGRGELVIAGNIMEGNVSAGMQALVWLDSKAYWALPVTSVEFIDRHAVGESLVGLVCAGQDEEAARTCAELCLPGDVIEVTEESLAV